MAANGISTLASKEAKQKAKLDLAQTKRQASGDTSAIAYRANNVYDLERLSLPYGYTDNQTINPLMTARPWVEMGTGLFIRTYNGYFADNPNWFTNAIVTAGASTNSVNNSSVPTTTSYQVLGYFRPTTTETYTFYTSSDDASYMWVGATATDGYTTTNALVKNGSEHGTIEQTGTIELVKGTLYAIRVQSGNNGGPGVFSFGYSTPTIAKTTNFGNVSFYNKSSNGL